MSHISLATVAMLKYSHSRSHHFIILFYYYYYYYYYFFFLQYLGRADGEGVGRPGQQADIELCRDVVKPWNLVGSRTCGQQMARWSDPVILQDEHAVALDEGSFNLWT